jgi:hypothetical protein
MIRKQFVIALALLGIVPPVHAGEVGMPITPDPSATTFTEVYVYSIYYYNKSGGPTHSTITTRAAGQLTFTARSVAWMRHSGS